MTKTRNLRIGAALVAATIAVAGVVGAGAGHQSIARAAQFDGETYFRGLFFGTGPVAQLLPGLSAQEREPLTRESLISRLNVAAAKVRQDGGSEQSAVRLERVAADLTAGRLTMEDLEKASSQATDGLVDAKLREMRILEAIRAQEPGYFAQFAGDMQSGDHLRIEKALDRAVAQFTRAATGLSQMTVASDSSKCIALLPAVAIVIVYFKIKFWGDGETKRAVLDGGFAQLELVNSIAERFATNGVVRGADVAMLQQ